jgi:putative ABC transport system permease protein
MIGIGLVSFVAVFAQGLKASVTGAIDDTLRGDLIISGKSFQPIPAASAAAVRATPGVADVVAVLTDEARSNGAGRTTVFGVDPAAAARGLSFEWVDGSEADLRGLGPGQVVVEQDFADSAAVGVGDPVVLRASSGAEDTYRVAGVFRDRILFEGGVIASRDGFGRLFTARDPIFVLATVDPGADPVAVKDEVAKALAPFPAAEVRTNAEYRDEISSRVDSILYLLYVLLAMSVVISLFGIVNTLVLSITERTREIGMLRAIGLTRSQLRRMVRYESVITSGIGGVIGIILGVVLAWVFSLGLRDEGIVFRIPWTQLVIFLVVAVVAGVLAAVLPARRAARLDPLDALHYE